MHSGPCTVAADLVASCAVWWGAAVTGTASLTDQVATAERVEGRRLDIVHTYHRWYDRFPTASERELSRSGHLLLINWEPTDRAGRPMSWAAIAGGSYDAQIRQLATALKSLDAPVLLSFSHEPEANFAGHGGSAAAFVAAFRHLHDLIAPGTGQVRWVWDVMGLADPVWRARYRQLYPGDRYVDWIGWDPYNWASCRNRAWQDAAQTVTPFYQWLQANGFGGKPFLLAELGTVEHAGQPGGKAAWFTGLPATVARLPNLRAVVYFDLPAPPANCDWRVNTSARSAAGYRAAGRMAPFAAAAQLRLP